MVINLYLNLVTFIVDFDPLWYVIIVISGLRISEAKLVFFIPINQVRFDYYYINRSTAIWRFNFHIQHFLVRHSTVSKERHRDLQ